MMNIHIFDIETKFEQIDHRHILSENDRTITKIGIPRGYVIFSAILNVIFTSIKLHNIDS